MNRQEELADFYSKEYAPLEGSTVISVLIDNETDEGEVYVGLLMQCKDGKKRIAWVLRDAEGNGPGHLDVLEVE